MLISIGLAKDDDDSVVGRSDSTNDGSPVAAMFDPKATQDEVIASISTDFCGDAVSDVPFPNGSRYVTCLRDERFVAFNVWPDAETFEIAQVAGIDCDMDVVIWGPTWTAQMMSAADAQPLLDGGASQGTCDRS